MPRDDDKEPAVYILASQPNGTLYIGVTSDLWGRMQLHKQGFYPGFSKKYSVTRLVYFEMHPMMDQAIQREKRLKKWNRLWKIRLIEQINPTWADLFDLETGIQPNGPGGQSFDSR